jgi:hypothetical protein
MNYPGTPPRLANGRLANAFARFALLPSTICTLAIAAESDAYEFFVKRDEHDRPVWTRQIGERGAVFEHAGRCYRSGISYSAGLRRYVWSQVIPSGYTKFTGGKGDVRFEGGFGVYDAPEPIRWLEVVGPDADHQGTPVPQRSAYGD